MRAAQIALPGHGQRRRMASIGNLNRAEDADVACLLGRPDASNFGCNQPRKAPRT